MIGVGAMKFVIASTLLAQAIKVSATETITYTYDAVGRLVATAHSGDVNNGLNTGYQHDAADNRTQVIVAGQAFAPAIRDLNGKPTISKKPTGPGSTSR